MRLKPAKLYLILSGALVSGYLLLCYTIIAGQLHQGEVPGLCLVKHITGVPCPSCGSTRSVMALINGNLAEAMYINPFGFIIAAFMLLVPIWLALDFLLHRKSLYDFYCRSEIFLRKPKVAVPLIIMVLINWIWNITKGL
jgi:hypothetical protein